MLGALILSRRVKRGYRGTGKRPLGKRNLLLLTEEQAKYLSMSMSWQLDPDGSSVYLGTFLESQAMALTSHES